MSPQEIQVLQNFLDQLVKAQGISKDVQAQQLITEAVSKQPDASYLLVQRALLLEQALNNANSQIASLQADVRELQANRASGTSGFLNPAASAWGNSASSRTMSTSTAMPPPLPASYVNAAAPVVAMATPTSSFFGGGVGNVLGTVAATAAGVAAGAFLFQGIEHLMGNQSHGQMLDNSAAQLNQGGGDLLPGYFDQGSKTATETPVAQDTSNLDTASLDDGSDYMDDSDDLDLA